MIVNTAQSSLISKVFAPRFAVLRKYSTEPSEEMCLICLGVKPAGRGSFTVISSFSKELGTLTSFLTSVEPSALVTVTVATGDASKVRVLFSEVMSALVTLTLTVTSISTFFASVVLTSAGIKSALLSAIASATPSTLDLLAMLVLSSFVRPLMASLSGTVTAVVSLTITGASVLVPSFTM